MDNVIGNVERKVEDTYKKVDTQIQGTYRKLYGDLQEWAFSNNLMVIASGFMIGTASKEVIEKLLELLVKPVILFLLQFSFIKILYGKALVYVSETTLAPIVETFGNISWSILEWVVIILMTFVILEYLLNRSILGLKSSVKENDKASFFKAKSGAEQNIIPTSEAEVKKNIIKDELEKEVGKHIVKQETAQLAKVAETAAKGGQVQVPTTSEMFAGSEFDDLYNWF